jgi:hypothetical protein
VRTTTSPSRDSRPRSCGRPRSHTTSPVADVAASFQAAVAEQLLRKLRQALERYEVQGLALAGGVAANSALREGVATWPVSSARGPSADVGHVHRQRRDDRGRRDVPTRVTTGRVRGISRRRRTGSWWTCRERPLDSVRDLTTAIRIPSCSSNGGSTRRRARCPSATRSRSRRRRTDGRRARAWCCCVTSTTLGRLVHELRLAQGSRTRRESLRRAPLVLRAARSTGPHRGRRREDDAAESDEYFATRRTRQPTRRARQQAERPARTRARRSNGGCASTACSSRTKTCPARPTGADTGSCRTDSSSGSTVRIGSTTGSSIASSTTRGAALASRPRTSRGPVRRGRPAEGT